MKTPQIPACTALGQQSAKVGKNFFHAPDEDTLVKGGGIRPRESMYPDEAILMHTAHSAATAANPANSPASSLGVPSSRRKPPVVCSDFFETCKWGDDEEDAAEFREYLVRKVHRDHPGLSPQAFEKKLEELDAVEEKKSQEYQKAWLKNIYEQILAGSS